MMPQPAWLSLDPDPNIAWDKAFAYGRDDDEPDEDEPVNANDCGVCGGFANYGGCYTCDRPVA